MHFQPCKLSDIKVGAILGWKGSVMSLGRPIKYKITKVVDRGATCGDIVLLRIDASDPQKGTSFNYPFSDYSIQRNWYLLSTSKKEFTDEEYEELLV